MDNSVKIIGLDFNLCGEGVTVGVEIDKTMCSAFEINDDELKKLIKDSVTAIGTCIGNQVSKVVNDTAERMANGESIVYDKLLANAGIKKADDVDLKADDVDLKEKEALARQIMNSLKREVRDKK